MPTMPLAWRLARRELRGGLRGFRIFLACLALGVAVIAGVGSLSAAVGAGLRADARAMLGGDVELHLVHRPATPQQRAYLAKDADVSEVAQMRAMARTEDGDERALVELKAVDGAYPLYGAVTLDPAQMLDAAIAKRDGHWGALLAPGALVGYGYRLRLPPGTDTSAWVAAVKSAFPDAGWRIREFANAAPNLQRLIGRVTVFMTLVGLTALLVGGVGVGNAVRGYLGGKTATIATLKCLGAPGRLIFTAYLTQILALAAGGIAIGLVLGALTPALAMPLLSSFPI